jgi:2-polyprenyl-3-methyl-5-hydroxy-6-metoxy-1,4-benzoquinol methylase
LSDSSYSEYQYRNANAGWAHSYLLAPVLREVTSIAPERVFEIGAGSGFVASRIAELGTEVVAIEPSESGVEQCRRNHPQVRIDLGSAYDNLADKYGQFPLVLSLEVVEHLYSPRLFAKAVHDLLLPGGTCIISTPYHGYWKNLVLAASGKMDDHFTALWDGGHIKFWSAQTITQLLSEAGLGVQRIERVGRIPALAKSMIVVATRPKL